MSGQVRLTLSELEGYRGQGSGTRCGRYLRYFCPIHGSDKQRSLALNPETGHFRCFACGAWGYLEEKRQEWIQERKKESPWRPPEGRTSHRERAGIDKYISAVKKPVVGPSGEPKARPELEKVLQELQEALPGSLGEEYLRRRGIPLELAQACGVGYAAPGKWPHLAKWRPVRQWKWGRLVFPHTNPAGEVVNLYGRAVGSNEKVPKEERHDHLPGPKGIFNAKALASDTVFICEGVFDALSLMAAGYPNAVAIFGVDGLRWEWVKAGRVVFCLDQDEAGERWRELAWEGILSGKEVYFLPKEVYAGYKDLNEAWVAIGRLDIGAWEEPVGDTGAVAERNETVAKNTGGEGTKRAVKQRQNSGESEDINRLKTGAKQDYAQNSGKRAVEQRQAVELERPEPNLANRTEPQKREGPAITLRVWPDTRTAKMSAQDYSQCPCCGGARWWVSVYEVRVCGKCHPPANPGLVSRWEGEQDKHQAG